VTVTSPGLRGVRDRIRYNGKSVTDIQMMELARRISIAHSRLADYKPGTGYLSPSGLFIIAGVVYAQARNADVIVLEAGMGGISDEVSLFRPTVLAITKIFGEHVGVLGDTPSEIARDKAGVTTAATKAVVSLQQEDDVKQALLDTVSSRSNDRVKIEFVETGASSVPVSLLAEGLGRQNSELGCVAAQRLLTVSGYRTPEGNRLSQLLSSVALPGRCSWHDVPGTAVRLFADAAINRTGIAAALTEASKRWDTIDHVLVCIPDHKDMNGATVELGHLPVTYIRLTDKPRLSFTHPRPDGWSTADADNVDRGFLADRGERIVALGTGYFIARMLDLAEADTEQLFHVPGT
jgi:dihydrofolate synthase / folylpolyglutamate synthase